ncbi:SDR family oxidoreductase [Sphingomonas sp. M1-B02]|uniref:SDR family oxidoreductase n=1 Tax=Sphingomonas sp. M1-B02 TaxID=3114300 RepID=UPI00223F4023|nr:SDR family oxidoreductase [Sphingomonas sp. S6-11]UZK64922.1 SDR family oxidoreductase [Sphingomonas sp. S6-11]
MAARAAFISGGASGIGQAVAKDLAARGWRVGLADINAAGLEATKAMLPAGMVTTHVMDVRDRDQWKAALADFAVASGGRLDFLFNNAGIAVGGPLETMSDDEVDRGLAININGMINGARAAHALLKATPGSAMIVTSSAAGISGNAGMSIYSAGKFAMRGFAESLNAEWGHEGIFVGSLMPSFIETPLLDHVTQDSNRSVRESVRGAGLEITPVDEVVRTVWSILEKRRDVHTRVGKTAHRLWFMAKWMPGTLRKLARKSFK